MCAAAPPPGAPSFSYLAVFSNCSPIAAVLTFAIAQSIKVLTTWYALSPLSISTRCQDLSSLPDGICICPPSSARATDVQKMVIGQGIKLAGVGLAIGLLGALAVTRLMTALLFEVRASDPTIYVAIAALLTFVAVAASWIPSRRAAALDPTKALHQT